ncbi:MAG TPA: TetR/AcrR family transcriptional regulator [Candidatus Kapabacteria bacterium]|nr:TetR/AcrR family transcriptional regulator [Candidatus Kapabacteria bacterium]
MATETQMVPRRERERLLRRKEILDAARTVFARKGFNEATLDDVAELAEFGKGTLYNYFPNKEALFMSVVEDSFEMMKGVAVRTFGSDLSFSEQVEVFIREELRLFFDNLESVQLMMREAHHLSGGNPLMQLMPQLLAIVADRISAEQKRRRAITFADSRDIAMILLNMLFGQLSIRIYRRFGALCGPVGVGETSVPDLFKDVPASEIEREVATATKLIHTVFFQGIGK